MATDYTIVIRGSGPTEPSAELQALLEQLRAGGHALREGSIETRAVTDVMETVKSAEAAKAAAGADATPPIP